MLYHCRIEFNQGMEKIYIIKFFFVPTVSILPKLNGILLPKLFWPTLRKICSRDREKLLKFEAEGREFAKILRKI